mgnify:CR=1 FL=1
MREPVLLITLFMVMASCGRVSREEVPSADTVSVIQPGLFIKADSMALGGDFRPAREELLRILAQYPERRDEVLFRLLGLHHGQAVEDGYTELLDSLELAGAGPLTGWKISALHLAGRPGDALLYLTGDDPFLSSLLFWEAESLASDLNLDELAGPGPAWSIGTTAREGTLSREELRRISEYAGLFPGLSSSLLMHLRRTGDTTGTWRVELLEDLGPGPGRDLLLAELMAGDDLGGDVYWLGLLGGRPELAVIAAGEVLRRFPESYVPSWQVVDALVSTGENGLAEEFSGAGDRWHRMGAEMAMLLAEKRYDRLMDLVGEVDHSCPDSLRARASLFRARALHEGGSSASLYHSAYLDFATSFPWHPLAREMAYNTGKYHDCEQEWREAADAYLVSLSCAGSFAGDERAHWRGGFCLYMSGSGEMADSLWNAGCEKWPAGYWRDEMLFWRARRASDEGNPGLRDSLLATVSRQHPWEFYGMLAAMRLGGEPSVSMPVPDLRLLGSPVCSLAVALTSSGYGVAAAEMLAACPGTDTAAVAGALSLLGRHGHSLSLLRALDSRLREGGGMLPDSLLCLYFPSPYDELARLATDTLLLEDHVLQGIMREESYFNRWVVSRAGARGVVQLMPATAFDVARWYGLPPLTEEEFFDPAASVPYGALYIDRQYRNYDGEYPLFLAAYNAGPGNATRWVSMHGWNNGDPELYIEQITYRETRIYVKKVLRSAWIYERR